MPEEKPATNVEGQNAGSALPSSVATQGEATSPAQGEPMEIHTPDKPIHSKKEFLFHMLTVVLGILIALTLDGIVTWAHHRVLVREARANIVAEIRQNKETIDHALPEIQRRQDQVTQIIAFLQEIERTHKVPAGNVNYNVVHYTIYSAAWQTAVTSGAVTYMPYSELRHYNDLYDGQQSFTSMQDDAFKALSFIGEFPTLMEKDPRHVPLERYENLEREASRVVLINRSLASIGEQLSKEYDKFLQQN